MRAKIRMIAAALCYGFGVVSSIYVGGWLMLIKPIHAIINAITYHSLTTHFLMVCIIKIILSLTVGGFFWCVGYVGYNHFKGTEDPDWDAINARIVAQNTESGEEK